MAAVIKAYKEYWDEMLAVGVGVVVTDLTGNTVKGFIGPWLEKVGLGNWADPISEFVIGAGVLAVSEMLIPVTSKWKVYGRLAAFGATAVAIADTIAIALGQVPAPAPARPAPRPTPAVRRPVPARPAPRPAPARPATVTVMPRPAAPTPTKTATEKAPKIFGS